MPVGSLSDLRVGPRPSSVPPTASCEARGDRTVTARAVDVRGAREAGGGGSAHGPVCGRGCPGDDGQRRWRPVHQLASSIRGRHRAGACAAHGLVWWLTLDGGFAEAGHLEAGW